MKEPRSVEVKGSFLERPVRNNSYISVMLQDLFFGESDRKKVTHSSFDKLICTV